MELIRVAGVAVGLLAVAGVGALVVALVKQLRRTARWAREERDPDDDAQ